MDVFMSTPSKQCQPNESVGSIVNVSHLLPDVSI